MATTAIASTLVGCVGCQAGVEFLQKRFDANLSLVTLAQFAFVVVAKLLTSRFEVWTGQKIPTRAYLKIVAIVFVVNLCNNSSIGYGVHFPLFIIFKSGSLLANMLLGILLRGYHYSVREIYSVLLVTGGVIIFTIASYDSTSSVHSEVKFDETDWTRLLAVPPFIIVPVSRGNIACQEKEMIKYNGDSERSQRRSVAVWKGRSLDSERSQLSFRKVAAP